MPELPEVESTRVHVAPMVEGARVVRAEFRHPRLLRYQPRPRDAADRLTGRIVVRAGRKGKFLLFHLEGDMTWVLHLGMSGRVQIVAPGEPEAPHTHLVAAVADVEVRFVDPRTFGFSSVLTPSELAVSGVGRLGPDALNELPASPHLMTLLSGRSAPIKSLLLNQRFLAGIGNIYADEALFRARIHPLRPGGSLTRDEVKALRAAIRSVLAAGLAAGGTSLDDLAYLLPDGRAGGYVTKLNAYGREGLPCPRCGAPIERTVLSNRSSFYCAHCQQASELLRTGSQPSSRPSSQ